MKLPKAIKIFLKAIYWILLSLFLFFFPVLHGWDALPEPFDQQIFLWTLFLIVFSMVILTRKRRFLHAMLIFIFLVGGGIVYAFNEGYLIEPPDKKDILILERTKELLSTEALWDRSEERTCDSNEAFKLTLYCALKQASRDVAGKFRHRRPSLQIVRKKIEEFKPRANYGHRLAGFNADPEVSLQELHQLLDLAIVELKSNLEP